MDVTTSRRTDDAPPVTAEQRRSAAAGKQVHRVARASLDDGTGDTITLPVPPRVRDELDRTSWTQTVLPMIGALGFVGFILISPSPLFILIGVLWVATMVGSAIALAWERRRRDRRRTERDRQHYGQLLGLAHDTLRGAAAKQWQLSLRTDPHPSGLFPVTSASTRLWERRPHHVDFLQVRWGSGDAPLRAQVRVPDLDVPLTDPVCQFEMQQVARVARALPAAPMRLDLRERRWTVVGGEPSRASDLARSLIAQVATWHGPDDVRLLIAASPERLPEWEWARWLPHVRWCEAETPGGSVLISRARQLAQALSSVISVRSAALSHTDNRQRQSPSVGPHMLVVLDGVELGSHAETVAAAAGPALGMTILEVVPGDQRWDLPWVDQAITVDDAGGVLRAAHLNAALPANALADRFPADRAEHLARHLAPWRVPARKLTDAARSPRLPELLGVGDLASLRERKDDIHRPAAQELIASLGITSDGDPLELDLKESARGGSGPHGLVIGATGSGKSELLRTIVTGLAITHPPETLAFVLIDFKGGATFAGMSPLPHVAGTITNLADDLALIERTHAALKGEIQRRQELLARAGNAVNILEYRRKRHDDVTLPPLPNLLVIIDEFSELISAQPDFIETFVAIGRLGRSLGVYLMLASQRLEEGRLKGLESHLSYRIVLRTFTAGDSQAVLGTRDAYHLPAVPGAAYLRTGTDKTQRFQSAFVSAAYDPSVAFDADADSGNAIVPFRATAPLAPSGTVGTPGSDAATPSTTVMSHVVTSLHDDTRRTHQIWVPPLASVITIGDEIGAATAHADRGLVLTDWPSVGRLRVPLAVADIPEEQQTEVVAPDLGGPEGSIVVVGAPQTGKSTFAQSFVMALALTHAPTEAAVYAIDLGGGRLSSLTGLPHVGGVVGRSEPEMVSRVLQHAGNLLDEREQLFRDERISSMNELRARRQQGRYPQMVLGDVFVVLDGAGEFRRSFDDLSPLLSDIAARGPGLGVHLVVTASRSMDLRSQVLDHIGTRFELRLNDPTESAIGRKQAAAIPRDVPGRGLMAAGRTCQLLFPSLARADDEDVQKAELASLVERIRIGWKGPKAPPVRVLPAHLSAKDLARPSVQTSAVPIGVGEPDLSTVALDLTADEAHVMVLGDARSGKTNILSTYLTGLVGQVPPEQAQCYVVDYRLGLLDVVPSSHLSGYASSNALTVQLVGDVAKLLEERQPAAGISAAELRARSWWTGPELYLIIDDYDLVGSGMDSPLAPLSEYVPSGHELGFHLVIARKTTGIHRAFMDGVVGRMKEFGNPAIVLSGDRNDGPLIYDVRAVRQPAGRGVMARAGADPRTVQFAELISEPTIDDGPAEPGSDGTHAEQRRS